MTVLSARYILLTMLLSLCCACGLAQDYVTKNYTVKDGMLSNEIMTVAQDKFGDMWIVTKKGILKYNGNRYTGFNTSQLRSNEVFDVWPTPDGRAYMLDYKSIMHYTYHDSLFAIEGIKGKIKALFYYDGVLWGMDRQTNQQYLILPGRTLKLNEIPQQYFDPKLKDNNAVYTYFSSPYIFNLRNDSIIATDVRTKQKKAAWPGTGEYSELIPAEGNLYDISASRFIAYNPAINKAVVQRFDNEKSVCYTIKQKMFFDNIMQLTTQNGSVVYNRDLDIVDSLRLDTKQKNIISIVWDKHRNFWLVTHFGLMFINEYFRNMLVYDQLKYRKITIFNNSLYALDEDGDISFFDSSMKKKQTLAINNTTSASNLNFFQLLRNGDTVVVATNKSISVINNNRCRSTTEDHARKMMLITIHDCQYYSGSLYVLTFPGLYRLELATYTLTRLTDESFKNILIDKEGNFYLSKADGIYYIPKGIYKKPQKLIDIANKPDIFLIDSTGNVILSFNEYIYYYDPRRKNVSSIRLNDEVMYMKCSGQYLWAVTNNNIYRYHYTENRYRLQNQYYNFNYSLYEDVRDICEMKDYFILAGNKGIVKIPYKTYLKPDENFTNGCHVEKIKYNNLPMYVGRYDTLITFPYRAKNVTFYFAVNTISYDNNVAYNYFTEGLDNQWQKTSSAVLTYPAISPGTYKMHLIATLDKYDLKSKEYVLTIVVRPLWWQMKPVKIVFAMAILTLLGWVTVRLTSARKNKALKRALIDKQMSELKLSALQSNMNPHFIFNALTSVQSFLRHNKNEVASVYITEFATLIRMYLEFSRKKTIGLDDEIKALKLYTSIEQKRFNDRFKTKFELIGIDDLSKITLPPLIIQPFIENAIVHGLYHKMGDGILIVTFNAHDGTLFVTIDDNGIGRARSKVINSSLHKAPSRGIQLIQERVDILNNENEKPISIDIIDKENGGGTTVNIRIPL